MKRAVLIVVAVALLGASPSQASFGLKDLDVTFTNADGSVATKAGSHPFALTAGFNTNTTAGPKGGEVPDGSIKDLEVEQMAGLVGSNSAIPRCSTAEFLDIDRGAILPACTDATAVGYSTIRLATQTGTPPSIENYPLYNLEPPPGAAAKLGFVVIGGVPVTIEVGVSPDPPYKLKAIVTNTSQAGLVFGADATIWGDPGDPVHDPYRGSCLQTAGTPGGELISLGECPTGIPDRKPFLTMPRACSEALTTIFEAAPWEDPDTRFIGTTSTQGTTGCDELGFGPQISAKPTNQAAGGPTGLDFNLDIDDKGLTDPTGTAESDIRKAVVTLPEGLTINPSQAEGLEACTEEDLSRETADSEPGEGCPEASKVGTVEVETPLAEEEILKGSLFVAAPYTNRFGSLVALYMTLKSPKLGVSVSLAGKVEPDPRTGRLITTFGEAPYELPQLPFSHFRLHFRSGGRSPLVTPPRCGEYETKAVFTPWANPDTTFTTTSSFKVTSGVNGSPCPVGARPFSPGFTAGSTNSSAGSFSPFYMRATRQDSDQELTRLTAKLPPGMVAKLAGTARCSDTAIAVARARTGEYGGQEELTSPSCPASSKIGRVLGGAGVGSELTWVPGSLYLAGPYNGAPLSVVSVVPAVVGPFDLGTIVTRIALQIDPRTAEVTADGARSDPIPHIVAGIPVRARDIRVYVDKPSFTLNPTSCDPFAVAATLWGVGDDPFDTGDDTPASLASHFQVTGCAALGFKPRLKLRLKGGTRRGAFPALSGEFRPRPGDANLAGLVLRLPHSAFLEQGHFKTICTRVQFAAKACPPGAVYGKATAYTPLLDEPLEGPVFLRSSDHNLPDLVALLHGIVDVEAVARIDSKHGGIRASFERTPDAPLTKVVVQMRGGQKGLIVNSTDICGSRHRADARFSAHNGKRSKDSPLVLADCKGKSKAKKHRRSGRR